MLSQELQRRNVIKSSISHIALACVFLEAADIIFPIIGGAPSGFRKTDEVVPEKSMASNLALEGAWNQLTRAFISFREKGATYFNTR